MSEIKSPNQQQSFVDRAKSSVVSPDNNSNPNLNLTSSAPKVPLVCPTHKKDFKYICETDNQVLCDTCRQSHKSLNHSLLFLSEAEKNIINSVPKYLSTANDHLKTLKELNLPQSSNDFKSGLEKIEAAKAKLIEIIENYFKQLSQNYQFLYCKFPSAETRDILVNKISAAMAEVEAAGKKSSTRDLTALDIGKFYEKNILKEQAGIDAQVKALNDAANDPARGRPNRESLPQVIIKEDAIEAFQRRLVDYVSTAIPADLTRDQILGISIELPNYYREGSKPALGTINDAEKTIALFSTEPNLKPVVKPLNATTEIPYSHSSIISPEGGLFITGGCSLATGNITSATYKLSADTLNLEEKAPMIVKRVGHSLTYVDNDAGHIYAIGGRADNNVRTKLCERYLIKENKWERIANLNFARSRAAVCSFNNKFLYAFYGTDSFGNNVQSIEKFDIDKNEWTVIDKNSILPGFEGTFGAAVQVNKNQIMLFGGFSDSENFKDCVTPNRRVIMFNVKSESFQIVTKTKLPTDFSVSNSSSPIVSGGAVFCIGHFYQKMDSDLRRVLDVDYLLRIDKEGCEIKSVVNSDKGHAE